MYTDEDLDFAVEQGVLTKDSVAGFRQLMARHRKTALADEENFRLVTGFNDIFVVTACLLLLISTAWVLNLASNNASALVFTLISWGLAEYFVRKRKMALPAIILLLTFIGGAFAFTRGLFSSMGESASYLAYFAAAVAALVHWWRFRVPITVAAGTAAATGLLLSIFIGTSPDSALWLQLVIFCCGLAVFVLAMYWDAADVQRIARDSDVAFWLHLLSAPLIIHPVFSGLGVLQGNDSAQNMVVVIILYLLMTLLSLLIDRRALMISSLFYVLYALSALIARYGGPGHSLAVTGVLVGTSLLLLAAYWHRAREALLVVVPSSLTRLVPPARRIS